MLNDLPPPARPKWGGDGRRQKNASLFSQIKKPNKNKKNKSYLVLIKPNSVKKISPVEENRLHQSSFRKV